MSFWMVRARSGKPRARVTGLVWALSALITQR